MKFLARGYCVGATQSHSSSTYETHNLFINTFFHCFQILLPCTLMCPPVAWVPLAWTISTEFP